MLHIGTSGWQYPDWRGRLYPAGVPKARWLEYYAGAVRHGRGQQRVPTGCPRRRPSKTGRPGRRATSSSLSRPAAISPTSSAWPTRPSRWAGSWRAAASLGPKLGPVLVQVPQTLHADPVLLDEALSAFGAGVKVAFEPRDRSWETDRVRSVLEGHGAALCLADGPGVRPPHWRTAGWGYVRFHQGRARPAPCYGRAALSTWAERLAALWDPADEVFAFFNNDGCGCAPVRRPALRPRRRPGRALSDPGPRPARDPGRR